MIPFTLETVLYAGAIGLTAIGAVGMVMSNHMFRMVLALVVAEAGVNLLLILSGYRGGAVAPILEAGAAPLPMVDPVPQALVLTAIVIGVGVQALAVGLLIRAYQAYGTLDVRELRRRMEDDLCAAAGVTSPTSLHAPGD
jgi:multicomponent Na+:H+ antiporter subunit C